MTTSSGGLIIAAAVFGIDLLLPLSYAVPMFYVLPILLTGLLPGRYSTILMAGSALLLTWIGAAFSPGEFTLEALTNRTMASVLLVTIGWLLLIHKESAQKITAARQARDENEERLRLAQAAEGFGTFDWDIPGERIIWSPEKERMWGLPVGGFEGTYEHWRRLVHPEDVAEAERMARLALDNPSISYAYDYRIVRPDGTVRWIHAKATTLRDAAGRPIRMVGVNADITDRKQAEESLQRSEANLHLALNASRAGSWSWDVATNIFTWDDRYHQLYGYASDQPRTFETWMSSVYHEDQRRLQERITAMLATPGDDAWSEEFRAVHPTTGERWMQGLGRVERDPSGRAMRFAGLNLDITERKGAEEALRRLNETLEQRVAERTAALRETEERFRGIFEHSAEGIVVTDLEGRFVQSNAAYCAIVGYTEPELRGVQFQSLIHPDDRPHNTELIRQLMSGEVPTFGVENRYITKSGAVVWVHKHGSILRDDQGMPTHLMVLVTNISERKEVEEELHRQQASLEDLNAKLLMAQETERRRLARELHDDITQRIASLAIDLQSLRPVPPGSEASLIARVHRAGKTAEQITTDLQCLAHQLHPSLLEHVGLEAAVQEYVEEFEARTELKTKVQVRNLPIDFSLDRATCLYRVLQESLQNVRKHANATYVVIRLLGSMRGVGLCVHDDGRGFDHAQQVSNGRKGLGLISMEERVGALQGTFRLKPKPGDGTELHAWVPLSQCEVSSNGGAQA